MPASDGVGTALMAQGLSFRYGAKAPHTLREINLDFKRGSVVALTGPSGRGKSTLLYLLGLLLSPTEGDILVDGAPTSRLSDAERSALRATKFGFVFQDAALNASRSVLDNVLEPSVYSHQGRRAEYKQRALGLLALLGVEKRAVAKPGQVSGGQAARIALCRALLCAPPILIADEPTGNLDLTTANLVLEVLRVHAQSGGTVIIATHDALVQSYADTVIDL